MVDLSHWDFAETFKPWEVAELILGIPPESNAQLFYISGEQHEFTRKVTPVIRRVQQSFEIAVATIQIAIDSDFKDGEPHNDELMSDQIYVIRNNRNSSPDSRSRLELRHFERANFHRAEVSKWLRRIGMSSVYKFDLESCQPSKVKNGMWPWGDHHTTALGNLQAAAQRFWVNYDPSDPTTAPTNETVSNWLQTELGVTRAKADSIASILRPDGLKSGPRT